MESTSAAKKAWQNSGNDLIYLDSAATSWPKPDCVGEAMMEALSIPGSPGRSAHRGAMAASRGLFEARKSVARFLGAADASNIIFQSGCTQAANLALRGFLQPGDLVLVGPTEHNSVTRPLYALEEQGVELVFMETDDAGIIKLESAQQLLASDSFKAVVCQHASNVTGAIQPIAELAKLAHAAGACLIVDGAQAGGHLEVNLADLGADIWFCSGHKGLLGPQGSGVLYIAPDIQIVPILAGGTGSGGERSPEIPFARPDVYEVGTEPLPAIVGLGAAVEFLDPRAEELRRREQEMCEMLHEGLLQIPTVRVFGPALGEPRLPLVSITSSVVSPDMFAFELDRRWNIAVRAGFHCAPAAHTVMGTCKGGAARLSVSSHTTEEEVARTLEAIATLVEEAR